eukprot:CAMPEP_0178896828 /NCGR_PEP_ID=MMETSP0786-20121207/1401_1 /TAXON_ID=186022 /ORGANISM="Thalassionema frauenfeldii, Strain CCMP 1798" /LENGTH=162 /DNA_ID=CAMNT_0020567297 /DNA_START=1230 /DNA_END=1718 /DNA_ORIENTATION=+
MYLNAIFTPLQGFWNLCIYMFPKVKEARNGPNGAKISWMKAVLVAFSYKKTTRNSNSQTPAARTTQITKNASNGEEEKSEICDPESLQEPSLCYARNENDETKTRTSQTSTLASNTNHAEEEKSEVCESDSIQEEPSLCYASNENDEMTSPKESEKIQDDGL